MGASSRTSKTSSRRSCSPEYAQPIRDVRRGAATHFIISSYSRSRPGVGDLSRGRANRFSLSAISATGGAILGIYGGVGYGIRSHDAPMHWSHSRHPQRSRSGGTAGACRNPLAPIALRCLTKTTYTRVWFVLFGMALCIGSNWPRGTRRSIGRSKNSPSVCRMGMSLQEHWYTIPRPARGSPSRPIPTS